MRGRREGRRGYGGRGGERGREGGRERRWKVEVKRERDQNRLEQEKKKNYTKPLEKLSTIL